MSAVNTALLALLTGATPAGEAIGVNLASHGSGASHLLFVDAMKRARPWIPFVPGSRVRDSGAPVPVDARGLPTEVPFLPLEGGPPQRVRTLLFDDLDGRYPSGTFVLEIEGRGMLAVSGDLEPRRIEGPGRFPLEVQAGSKGIRLELSRSDPEDPIRDLRLWLPGLADQDPLLHPEMTTRLQGFSVARLTEPMRVNGGDHPCDEGAAPADPACRQGWAARTRPEDLTQAGPRGVALEHLVDLVRVVGADVWPGIPHAVDDEWVRGLAEVLRARFPDGRRVYVELSNETWNADGRHPQHAYFRSLGRRDGLFAEDRPGDLEDARRRAYLRRAVEVWGLLEAALGKTHRVVKILPGAFADPEEARRLFAHLDDPRLNPRRLRPDALAVGAWFGGAVADALIGEGRAKSATPDEVLDRLEASLGDETDGPEAATFAGLVRAHVALAARHQLPLVAYAGGPHLVVGAGEPSPLNETLHAAYRAPRLRSIYRRALDLWFGLGGGLFVASTFVEKWDWRGALGHLEYMHQPLEDAPRFRVLRERMAALGVELPPPRLGLPLGRRWLFTGSGTLPSTGVLVPLDPLPPPR